ncbi:MAG TPA: YqcC family protein [Porticoccaceae bacterium]
MTETHRQLVLELAELEAILQSLQLWHDTTPSATALASTAPFACDTLLFTEWLQFIFIPRLRSLAHARAPLPRNCNVTPMAEEYFGSGSEQSALVARITRIDRLLTEEPGGS